MTNGNLLRLFDLLEPYRQGGKYANKPDVVCGKIKGTWMLYSGSDYCARVDHLSAALIGMGIKKGDTVATILKNCPEWNFLDMAIMQIGAIHVPIYPTISAENFKYIFLDAEVKLVFVSNKEIYKRVASVIQDVPSALEVISVEKIGGVRELSALISEGAADPRPEELERSRKDVDAEELATIIYTSGTTGNPKGVMLSHRNFMSNVLAVSEVLPPDYVKKSISFLPLCHVYERVLNYMYHNLGISIYYSETIESLAQNLKEVQPEIFCAVPRVIEKFFDKIVAKGRSLSPMKKNIFFWAVNLGYNYQLSGRNSLYYKLRHVIADKLIFSKWREALGGNLKVIVSGGATLQSRLGHVFWAAGIQVIEGYGLTETSPVISVNTFAVDGTRIGTVGPALRGVQVKIAEDGEILCKSPGVMMGYFKLPEVTRQVIDQDGWFHTGDIGHLEEGGFLRITDRKKEIFKTSGGKFIAPQSLENKFKESAFIENIMVVGENQAFPSALIIPNFEHLKSWAKIKGLALQEAQPLIQHPDVVKRIQREVGEINKTLDKTEQIKKFRLLGTEWTPDSGELSPTLKLKRKVIQEKYKDLINELYARSS